jgi:hypothetical protein
VIIIEINPPKHDFKLFQTPPENKHGKDHEKPLSNNFLSQGIDQISKDSETILVGFLSFAHSTIVKPPGWNDF